RRLRRRLPHARGGGASVLQPGARAVARAPRAPGREPGGSAMTRVGMDAGTSSDSSNGKGKEKTLETIGVLGLGYVGLPLAVEFAEAGKHVVGVDVNAQRMAELRRGESYIEDIPS